MMQTREGRLARVSLIPAFGNLILLLFGRASNKFLGLALISASLVFIGLYTGERVSSLGNPFHRIEALNSPILNTTIGSEAAKSVTDADLLGIQNLVNTPQGILSFSNKLSVFATSYDKNCPGCSETTATGMKAGYGVIAVDPRVIPLGSRVFIPGYGIGVAGDTGGAIKGNKIDLGFDDIKTGWWSARFVEVYVLR